MPFLISFPCPPKYLTKSPLCISGGGSSWYDCILECDFKHITWQSHQNRRTKTAQLGTVFDGMRALGPTKKHQETYNHTELKTPKRTWNVSIFKIQVRNPSHLPPQAREPPANTTMSKGGIIKVKQHLHSLATCKPCSKSTANSNEILLALLRLVSSCFFGCHAPPLNGELSALAQRPDKDMLEVHTNQCCQYHLYSHGLVAKS